MGSSLTFLTLSSLLLFTSSVNARKDPAEYWKDVMKDQPMPEAIRGLLPSNRGSLSPLENQKQEGYNSESHLQNLGILYHGLDEHKEDTIPRKESQLNRYDSHLDIRQEEKKSFVKAYEHKAHQLN